MPSRGTAAGPVGQGWLSTLVVTFAMTVCAERWAHDCVVDGTCDQGQVGPDHAIVTGADAGGAGGDQMHAKAVTVAARARQMGMSDATCASIANHVEAPPQSVTIKAADVESVEVDVVPAVVAECDVLLNQQAKMYTQQRAEADDKLAGEIQAFMASAEQMRQELSDNVAALKAELAACTCTGGTTVGYGDLQLSRSSPVPSPAQGNGRLSQDNIVLGTFPGGAPSDPSSEAPFALPHVDLEQKPRRPIPVYQGPYIGVPVTQEEREAINMNKLIGEVGRGRAGHAVPAGLEQYTLNGTVVRVGVGTGDTQSEADQRRSRRIPYQSMATHSVLHSEGLGFHAQPNWCNIGPAVAEDVFPNAKAAFEGMQCFELLPGDMLYIPAEYWHWIFSEGFGVAVNVWSAKPHRRFTGPKKFPGGAADWPAIKAWTPERVVEMWTGGHNSGSGFQYDIDKKITCNPASDRNYILPEAVKRHNSGLFLDGLVDVDANEFLALAKAADTGEASNMSCMHLSVVQKDTPFGRSADYRFTTTMDATSNVSVFGSDHRVAYPGGGADGYLDWGYPFPRGTARGDKGFDDFGDLDEVMTHFGIDSIAEVMAAREDYYHKQPTMNYWMTSGKVQTGLHYDDDYNTLVMVRGRKQVMLFPRNLTGLLYPAVPRPGPVEEFEEHLRTVQDQFDIMLTEAPQWPQWPLQRERVTPGEHAFNAVATMLKNSRGLDLMIAMLLSGELMAHHGQKDFAKELLGQVKTGCNVANADVPALVARADAALKALN